MHKGQTVAIPVLDRHIKTSSGKCTDPEASGYASNCVMADALRDRFPGAEDVDVSNTWATFSLDGMLFQLKNEEDMSNGIRSFDAIIEQVEPGASLKEVIPAIRSRIPRVVHAVVYDVEQN